MLQMKLFVKKAVFELIVVHLTHTRKIQLIHCKSLTFLMYKVHVHIITLCQIFQKAFCLPGIQTYDLPINVVFHNRGLHLFD